MCSTGHSPLRCSHCCPSHSFIHSMLQSILDLGYCQILVDIHQQSTIHSQAQRDGVCVIGLKREPLCPWEELPDLFLATKKWLFMSFIAACRGCNASFLGSETCNPNGLVVQCRMTSGFSQWGNIKTKWPHKVKSLTNSRKNKLWKLKCLSPLNCVTWMPISRRLTTNTQRHLRELESTPVRKC